MPPVLHQDALGDIRNARFLGLACDLAYYPEAQGVPLFQEKLGLAAKMFSVGNTQAYVGGNDTDLVVAFRGTEAPTSIEGLKDWLLTDALNLLMLPEGRMGTDFAAAGVQARFHKGFMDALVDIWDPVYHAVVAETERLDRPLWITGHSLGGSLALLAAWLFRRKFISVHQIYTFGGPMIGNAAATAAFDKTFANRLFRYVNPLDPIPRLPTMSLIANEFGHCEKQIDVGPPATDTLWAEISAGAVGSIMNLTIMNAVWEAVLKRLGAHAMTQYLTHFDDPPQT